MITKTVRQAADKFHSIFNARKCFLTTIPVLTSWPFRATSPVLRGDCPRCSSERFIGYLPNRSLQSTAGGALLGVSRCHKILSSLPNFSIFPAPHRSVNSSSQNNAFTLQMWPHLSEFAEQGSIKESRTESSISAFNMTNRGFLLLRLMILSNISTRPILH